MYSFTQHFHLLEFILELYLNMWMQKNINVNNDSTSKWLEII